MFLELDLLSRVQGFLPSLVLALRPPPWGDHALDPTRSKPTPNEDQTGRLAREEDQDDGQSVDGDIGHNQAPQKKDRTRMPIGKTLSCSSWRPFSVNFLASWLNSKKDHKRYRKRGGS